jgi:hypothetical protein
VPDVFHFLVENIRKTPSVIAKACNSYPFSNSLIETILFKPTGNTIDAAWFACALYQELVL